YKIIIKFHKKKLIKTLIQGLVGQEISYRGEIEKLSSWQHVVHDIILSNKELFDSLFNKNMKQEGNNKDHDNMRNNIEHHFSITEHDLLNQYYSYLVRSSKNL